MSARFIATAALVFSVLLPLAARAETSSVVPRWYLIRPDDQLQVMVFGAQGLSSLPLQAQAQPATIQALSQTVTVLSDGTITYPLIGSIGVAGLPADQAAQRISVALSAYIIRPTVSVLVLKGAPATIEVLGSVEHGGQIELQHGDHLIDILARAGAGPSSYADLNHVTLNRIVEGVPHVYNYNLYNMLLNADYSSNPVLQPGDVVYVPKAKQHNLADITSIPFALYYLYLLSTPGLPH